MKPDYLTILNSAWEDHLVPRSIDAPTIISLFAGCGGSSLGYSMAGYKELLAVEWDKNAFENFKLNFPDVPVYDGDIANLSIEEVFQTTGLKEGQLDLLDGSPPCQGFSMAGKRIMADSRNQLFREYVRLLRGLKPKVFVMENVSGMIIGKMKLIFAEIMRELKASGYKVMARLVNAELLGVPQSRRRIIFIGVRGDLGYEPTFPLSFSYRYSVKDAFANLPFDSTAERQHLSSRMAEWWKNTKPGDSFDTGRRDGKKAGFNKVKICLDSPSPTVCSAKDSGTRELYSPNIPASLSISELKRVHSYPDQFQLVGSFNQKWARIGNSVPPLFMYSIANHIKQNILSRIIEKAA